MSTQVIDHPALPSEIQQGIGESARQRVELLDQRMTELEVRGEIKPATILNALPFTLSLGSGLVPYEIPAAPAAKPFFTAHTVDTCRSFPVFKGNREMSDKSLKPTWDVNIVLPIQQAMEFKHYYMGETDEDHATKDGGVVVFEGTFAGLTPKSEVRSPSFLFRKRNRYIVFETRILGDLIKEAEDVMKTRALAKIQQADVWYDDREKRRNIQAPERRWHDLALARQWITTARPWRTGHVEMEQRCPRCREQYVSTTGVCKCSYVVEPFTAYMAGEILVDHVRMSTLKADQWNKVKAEQTSREAARA